MKKFFALFYYQFLQSCRVPESIFFTILLSPILFIIFGIAFHIDTEYAEFFLPGIIGSMVCSDALYSVGPVIKKYYSLNIVKYFYNYPVKLPYLFMGFIAARIIFILFSMLLLIAVSYFIFGFSPNIGTLCRYILGIFLIFTIYSFAGLSISLWGLHDNKDQGVIGLYYMLTIFLSDCFFVLTKANVVFDIIGYFFPLRCVLDFIRGSNISLWYCTAWVIALFVGFAYIIKRISFKR